MIGRRMDWHRQDALAGVTTAAVVIPQAMAYATIAGLPVEVGLYTALVPMLAYALLGGSRALSVSTTSTLAALTGATVGTVAGGDADRAIEAATTLAMLTGVLLLVASVFKLGFIADFISQPVLAGFKAGTGLLIAVGQLGKVLGIEQTGDNFFEKTRSALSQLGEIDWATAALSAVTIALLLGLKRWAPAVPGALVAVGVGVAVGAWSLLDVALTGAVPSGLPHPVAPDLDLIGPLFPAAAGVALMAFVESIAAGRAVTRTGEEEPDADRELRALGAANLLGGVFRALPAGGGLSQTAVNDNAGASSRLAGAVTGIVALLTLLFLTGVFADLPQATLGALVLVSALGLFSLQPLNEIRAIHLRGYVLGLVTLVAVLALGVLEGVLAGVVTSMILLVHALDHPDIRVADDAGDASSSASSAGCTSPTPSASGASCSRWSSSTTRASS
jgi:sulfate permease, SulP family